MSGKHCNRVLRVHKLMLEALVRLLLNVFQNQEESSEALSDEAKESHSSAFIKTRL